MTRREGRGPWTPEALAAATPVDNVRRELIDGWLYIDGQPTDDPMADLERPIPVTPSLVCEVSSPSTRSHDLVRKRRVYERDGVTEYWFVDHDGLRFEVYRHDGEGFPVPTLHYPGEVLEPVSLPGVTVDVATVLDA